MDSPCSPTLLSAQASWSSCSDVHEPLPPHASALPLSTARDAARIQAWSASAPPAPAANLPATLLAEARKARASGGGVGVALDATLLELRRQQERREAERTEAERAARAAAEKKRQKDAARGFNQMMTLAAKKEKAEERAEKQGKATAFVVPSDEVADEKRKIIPKITIEFAQPVPGNKITIPANVLKQADDVRGAAQLRQTPLALAAAQNAHGARRAARLSRARGCRGDMTLKLPS